MSLTPPLESKTTRTTCRQRSRSSVHGAMARERVEFGATWAFLLAMSITMMAPVHGFMLGRHVVVVVDALAPSSLPAVPTAYPQRQSSHQHVPRPCTALYARTKKKKRKKDGNTISVNRLAYRNYEIIDTLEAGVSLLGTEVKSIRDGKMNIRDGYIRPTKDGRGCVLYNVHIGKHTMSSEYFQHEETRPRQLLVHKQQARRLLQQTEQQGMTIVPLKAYFNDQNKVKLQIALCKGKNVRDKRQTIKDREAKRDANRIIKNFRL